MIKFLSKIKITYLVIALLALVLLVGAYDLQSVWPFINFLAFATPAFIIWLVLKKMKRTGIGSWEDLLISHLILSLLITPIGLAWYYLSLLGILLLLLKIILRPYKRPLFNPTALILIILLLFPQFIPGATLSWWGPSEWIGSSIIVLLGGIYFVLRLKKIQLVFSFLLASFVMSIVFNFWHGIISLDVLSIALLSGNFWFFLLIMLIEPKTSPAKPRQQLIAGTVAGALFPFFLAQGFFDARLLSIIIINIANVGFMYQTQRKIVS